MTKLKGLRWRSLVWLLLPLWAVQLLLLVYYLSAVLPSSGVPFDDAWIHFVFARNLAEYGELSFNVGQWSGGTTSLLWDLLLACGYRLSGRMLLTAYLLGGMCYVLAATGLLILLTTFMGRTIEGRGLALVGAVCYATMGFTPYLALSGMDTLLFVALAIWSLVTFVLDLRRLASGLLAALVVTRIEGIGLIALLATVILIKNHYRPEPLLRFLSPSAIALGVYLLFNLAVTGSLLPSTMAGRKWLWGFPEGLWAFSLTRTSRFWRDWMGLLRHFILAGCGGIPVAYWITLVILGAAGGLGMVAFRRGRQLGFNLLIAWALIHNLAYLFLAPLASWRHQVPNLVLLPTLATTGCLSLSGLCAAPARRRWTAALTGLATLVCLLPGTTGYRQAFSDHVAHINSVHVAAGRWIADSLPRDAVVAAFDIGAVKYFGHREIIDLGGLTDANLAEDYLYPRQAARLLRERDATHLALPEPARPGQTDLGSRLGLTEDSIGARLKLSATFQIPPYIKAPYTRLPYQFYPAYRRLSIYEIDQRH
jgi:hypothetical protein